MVQKEEHDKWQRRKRKTKTNCDEQVEKSMKEEMIEGKGKE